MCEQLHGPEHPEVAIRANNIGQILHAKGDLEGALRYAKRAVRIRETVYGPDHPSTKLAARNLSLIQLAKGAEG